MVIFNHVLEAIGNTPMLKINGIYAKLETLNPSGSIKDRMASYIIERAEKRGELKKGSEIIELTSGNTGIAFSMISAVKGYRFTAVMPECMSIERREMICLLGGKLVLTPAKEDMAGASRKYKELVRKNPKAWLPKQFENPDNVGDHERRLGPEIIKQMNGKVDAFVAGVGTGGTLIGVGKALRKINPKVKLIAVEPTESAVMSGKKPGVHKIEGIGEGFIPGIIQANRKMIDDVIAIKSDDAIAMSRKLATEHGLLVGISSGANMLAAMKLRGKYRNIVTVFPDRGERYLSMKEFED